MKSPSVSPTVKPTKLPTSRSPSASPSVKPSNLPTTKSPSKSPSVKPSQLPSTKSPSKSRSVKPSQLPSTKSPSKSPTRKPTSKSPSMSPTVKPTSKLPSTSPTRQPTTSIPSSSPTRCSFAQVGNKLVGTGNTGAALQGTSVSISGDGNTAILGGYGDNSNRGAAWIFVRSRSTWSQQGSKLVGTGAIMGRELGISVSISSDGNIAIVGGYTDDTGQGAAWIFRCA